MPSGNRESEARNLVRLFKTVEQVTASITNAGTITVTPPSGTAGKIFFVPSVTDALSATVATSRITVDDVNITNGAIASVELINNSGTTTRANLTWTFVGYF